MKKVGIATMTGGANYGNSLQNYAVQEILRALGYEPYTLKNSTKSGFLSAAKKPIPITKKLAPSYIRAYRQSKLNSQLGCKNQRDCSVKGKKLAQNNLASYREAKQRKLDKFAEFNQNYIRFDNVAMDFTRFPRKHLDEFYAFVCGSDQVWNPHYYTNSMIEFLQFAPKHKRIAFAPSFGISEIPDTRTYDFAKWINEIPHLSVREEAGAQIIRKLTGRNAKVLLDPTFGLSKEQWSAFARKPEQAPTGKFVFCYFLGDEINAYCKWIEKYAKANDCEIVEAFDIHNLRYYDIDPCEFVWLLSNAEAVFTDSFHGAAFSVNMEKPFVAFDRQEGGASMSSRITTLLNKTGLSHRKFSEMTLESVNQIDFTNSRRVVALERQEMHAYLRSSLETVAQGNHVLLANRYHCTGCGACENACPVGAIEMKRDFEGFAYPEINLEKCIHCGACERACPADLVCAESESTPEAYYAYTDDKTLLMNSSSGGAFSIIARKILQEGGVVFGAGYDESFSVRHMSAVNVEELAKLRTSKYVQSDIGKTYRQAKEALNAGKKVLFTGTCCQIAGLKQYLNRSYDNLYTIDIICHGVPSPQVWEEYLKQCHSHKKIKQINFRDKTVGWNEFSMKITYEDGTSYRELATKDPFERAFLANLYLRPVCYQCQYKTLNRVSDLTLADYWGVEVVHPELAAQQGVSLILVHSDKGRQLYDEITKNMACGLTDREKAVKMNHGALHSVRWNQKRKYFYDNWQKAPMEKLVKKCLKLTASQKIRRFIIINGSRVKQLGRKIRGK